MLTADADRVIRMCEGQARASGRSAIDVSHFLSAVMELEDCYGGYYLAVQGVDLVEVAGELSRESLAEEREKEGRESRSKQEKNGLPEDGMDNGQRFHAGEQWRQYVEDMNQTCAGKNPLIGRGEELERTIQILCRKDKNNVLHVGEPGVGKTALAYGLARKIVSGQVPKPLKDARLYSLDLGGLLAGTQYRGDFEKRFKEIMDGLSGEKSHPVPGRDPQHRGSRSRRRRKPGRRQPVKTLSGVGAHPVYGSHHL